MVGRDQVDGMGEWVPVIRHIVGGGDGKVVDHGRTHHVAEIDDAGELIRHRRVDQQVVRVEVVMQHLRPQRREHRQRVDFERGEKAGGEILIGRVGDVGQQRVELTRMSDVP
jgi:hypothetical protein